jgi:hypothetical protein
VYHACRTEGRVVLAEFFLIGSYFVVTIEPTITFCAVRSFGRLDFFFLCFGLTLVLNREYVKFPAGHNSRLFGDGLWGSQAALLS